MLTKKWTRNTGFVLFVNLCDITYVRLPDIISLCLAAIYKYIFVFPQNKFAAFCQYAKTFNSDVFDYDKLKNADHVFMRWKEHFLVPDHTIRDISGASFAGFYYICFQKSTSSIEGYYYHRSSEW